MFVNTGSSVFLIHMLRCDYYTEILTQYVRVASLEVVVFLPVSLKEVHSIVT